MSTEGHELSSLLMENLVYAVLVFFSCLCASFLPSALLRLMPLKKNAMFFMVLFLHASGAGCLIFLQSILLDLNQQMHVLVFSMGVFMMFIIDRMVPWINILDGIVGKNRRDVRSIQDFPDVVPIATENFPTHKFVNTSAVMVVTGVSFSMLNEKSVPAMIFSLCVMLYLSIEGFCVGCTIKASNQWVVSILKCTSMYYGVLPLSISCISFVRLMLYNLPNPIFTAYLMNLNAGMLLYYSLFHSMDRVIQSSMTQCSAKHHACMIACVVCGVLCSVGGFSLIEYWCASE